LLIEMLHRALAPFPKRIVLTRFFLVLLICGWAKASPVHVAVNDLTPRGVATTEAEILGDRLRMELLGTGAFRVMERGQMDQILKEQSFQSSGGCDQSECAIEIGKLLAVDRMIVGSVGKIGELFTIQARILDVQTGEIVFSANQDYEGKIEGLLSKSIPELARRLAVAVQPKTVVARSDSSGSVAPAPRTKNGSDKPVVAPMPATGNTTKGASKSKSWVRWTSGSAAVGTGIVALLWRRESLNQKVKADKAVAEYNKAESGFEAYKTANEQAVSRANTATTKAIVWGGLSGLMATTFLVTFAF